MARVVESAVREGFICPICMEDLGTVDMLQQHFDTTHTDLKEDAVGNILSLISRAKKKIMQNPEPVVSQTTKTTTTLTPNTSSSSLEINQANGRSYAFYDNPYEFQPLGCFRKLTDDFNQFRKSQMTRTALEMNKLLIRLEKLTGDDVPIDLSKRKAYEQRVVTWIEDSLVNNCPSCGVKFGVSIQQIVQAGELLRRRHHCRMCGYLICSNCSHFLPVLQARRLVDMIHARHHGGMTSSQPQIDVLEGNDPNDLGEEEVGPLSFIQRTDSFSSLNSIIPGHPDNKNYELRCCSICREILELKFQQIEERYKTPFVVRLYEKLRREMQEIEDILPDFQRMSACIFEGKTTYTLASVNDYRNDLKIRFEKVAMLGKRLEDQGKIGDFSETHPRQSLLLSSIGAYARRFVLEKMTPLRALPRPDDYEQLVLERLEKQRLEQEAEEMAIRERVAALKLKQTTTKVSSQVAAVQNKANAKIKQPDCWIPETHGHLEVSASKSQSVPSSSYDMAPGCSSSTLSSTAQKRASNSTLKCHTKDLMLDTLEVQLTNVRNYLAQAKSAGRKTEVITLQHNLAELMAGYEQRKAELRLESHT